MRNKAIEHGRLCHRPQCATHDVYLLVLIVSKILLEAMGVVWA